MPSLKMPRYLTMAGYISAFVAATIITKHRASSWSYLKSSLTTFSNWLNLGKSAGRWRFLAILMILMNFKSIPFVWHFRIFGTMFYQLYAQPTQIPPTGLFRPAISRLRNPITECDWNLHKTNSSYFSDLDVSRTALFTAILRKGITKSSKFHQEFRERQKKRQAMGLPAEEVKLTLDGAKVGADEPVTVALGGVACVFHREIKPLAKFEIWTRILTWDRKWIYLISHIVECETWSKRIGDQPTGWILQPWKNKLNRFAENFQKDDEVVKDIPKTVYATSIAKYVVKMNRITVSPELVLIRSDMLPEKPDWAPHFENLPTLKDYIAKSSRTDTSTIEDPTAESVKDSSSSIRAGPSEQSDMGDWASVECKRVRGLEIAEAFAKLDEMRNLFLGNGEGEQGVLGSWFDFDL